MGLGWIRSGLGFVSDGVWLGGVFSPSFDGKRKSVPQEVKALNIEFCAAFGP
jgi:hypothetical protein